jgi:hypothetical protein
MQAACGPSPFGIAALLAVILSLFENFEAKCAKNGSKNKKNLFSKCVLDFHFAPIKGSMFFIFYNKKSNSLYPSAQPTGNFEALCMGSPGAGQPPPSQRLG